MHVIPAAPLLFTLLSAVPFALAHSSSDVYAPKVHKCPSDVRWLRPAHGLSKEEDEWRLGRKRVVKEALREYLARLEIEDLDLADYMTKLERTDYADVPIISFATSGGAWGAALTGTGAYKALDGRDRAAIQQRTGGLLQAMTYITGLSGGSWPTFSFPLFDFPTVKEAVDLWHTDIGRFDASANTTYTATNEKLFGMLDNKHSKGFGVSIVDWFGLNIGYEFTPGPDGGAETTISGIAQMDKFRRYGMPMPIGMLTEVGPGMTEYYNLTVPNTNGTAILYEISPFEFGTWQGPAHFTPTKWAGTNLTDGKPTNNDSCVTGFDSAPFVMSTMSAAQNFWFIEAWSNGTVSPFPKRSASPLKARSPPVPGDLGGLIGELASVFEERYGLSLEQSTAAAWPNPFHGLATNSSEWHSSQTSLSLVDSSEAGQGIPYWPLIQPGRNSSFIMSWENMEDAANQWNNGTNIRNTYLAAQQAGLPFPKIPSIATMVKRGYNMHPTLFGCNASLTTTGDARSPIVAYMANAPYSAYTNYTLTQIAFSKRQMNEIIDNSFAVVTRGNSTVGFDGKPDPDWPVCLGCAAIDRSLGALGIATPQQCEQCFQRYCWDGTEDSDVDVPPIDPTLILSPGETFAEWNNTDTYI